MVSQVLVVIVECMTQHIEKKTLLDNAPYKPKIWRTYVDDITLVIKKAI